MYKVEKVTPYCPAGHTQAPDYFKPNVRGRRWVGMPQFATEAEAEAMCALLNQAFKEGREDVKNDFRALMDIAEIDHEH